jgi:hypothetical protein
MSWTSKQSGKQSTMVQLSVSSNLLGGRVREEGKTLLTPRVVSIFSSKTHVALKSR